MKLERVLRSEQFSDERELEASEGIICYSAGWQMAMLGLEDEDIEKLRGKKVLDVGCGREANLVRYLREKGIEAEGIDSKAPAGDWFIRQNVTNEYPWEGSIMRGNNEYDLVISNCVNILADTFSSHQVAVTVPLWREVEDTKKMARSILSEMIRVVKPGCKVLMSPFLDKLDEQAMEKLKGSRIEKVELEFIKELEQALKGDENARAMVAAFGYQTTEGNTFPDFLRYAMAIYKER